MSAANDLTGRVPDTAELADRLAILDLLARHSRGVDRADLDQLKAAYWPDATVAYGRFNGNAHEFCDYLVKAIRFYARTQHCVSNTIIELRGDAALTESCVTAYHYRAGESAEQGESRGDREMTYLGRYLDSLERRGGFWKLLHRQVVMDWNRNEPASAAFDDESFMGLARGVRYPDDPLYALLGR